MSTRRSSATAPSPLILLPAVCGLLLSGALAAPPAQPTLQTAGAPRAATSAPGAAPLAVLQRECGSCHGSREPRAGLELTSAAGVLRGSSTGPVVVPGKPDDSRLLQAIESGKMPPGRKLPAADVARLRQWITAGAPGLPRPSEPELTQHQVLPILHLRCVACHGTRRQEGGLDLRTRAAMLKGGKSGPALAPGNPDASLLVKRIRANEMPPPRLVVSASVKPVEPPELKQLEEWIRLGAPEVPDRPDIATLTPDPLVSQRDRQFWSFRSPRRPPVPSFTGKAAPAPGLLRNPVDAFLYRDLQAKGLTFAPEVGRRELFRRVTLDLTGMPPTPAEMDTFLADHRPDAYERAVDRLLASPRYGEQWGRRWLDLAGYCDSEGISDSDPIRPAAWRYRDYVIRSLNADKPYNRFLLEQVAGDELADYERAPVITPEIADNLIATGFLRQGPDGTFANITAFVPDRLEIIHDAVTVLTSSMLGLTLRCARCHDHKFDPLPQRDYYRLLATFKGAYDEHDWIKSHDGERPGDGPVRSRDLPHVTTEERSAWETREKARRAAVEQVQADLKRAEQAARARVPAAKEDAELRKQDAAYNQVATEAEKRLRELETQREAQPIIRALWDRGEPSPTYILRRGDYLRPGRLVGPGVPSVLTDGRTPFVVTPPWPGAKKTGRRLAFARWLTRPDHPLTARVLVNRIWKEHFGRGLVLTPDNFGRTGAPPTHPELLDWLATAFVAEANSSSASSNSTLNSRSVSDPSDATSSQTTRATAGAAPPHTPHPTPNPPHPTPYTLNWSLKALHRLLVTSRAYRQSSEPVAAARAKDPENRLLSRMPLRRLEAEELYDSLLTVAGRLDETRGGPPDPLEVRPDGMVSVKMGERGGRRAVYGLRRRRTPVTLLETFDFPQLNPNCTERSQSTVALQALQLLNSARMGQLATAFAERVRREAGEDSDRQIEHACRLALSRAPSAEEMRLARETRSRLEAEWRKQAGKPGAPDPGTAALIGYCRALLNSAEFLYVD